MILDEAAIPLRPEVKGACEMLGLDPLYVANEGKLVAVVPPEAAGACWRRCVPCHWARTPQSSEKWWPIIPAWSSFDRG